MTPSVDVAVVGGGVAGLAAATRLAELGAKPVVFEAAPVAGGRARSWIDPTTGAVVDNGQHLLMGCYAHTLAFLTRIGARARVAFQESLRVDFLDAAGGRETLACPPLPGSLSLLAGLAMFRWLTFGDRLGVLAMARDVKTRKGDADGADESAEVYLQRWGQSADARRGFWDPLIFATLNEDPRIASARTLRNVLRIALLGGPDAARLGWSRVGLGDLYAPPAAEYLAARGAELRTSAPVAHASVEPGGSGGTVELRSGETVRARALVLALPPAALERVAPEISGRDEVRASRAMTTSPIVSVNLWLDREITELPFAGLLGTRFHWLFNRGALLDGCSDSEMTASSRLPEVSLTERVGVSSAARKTQEETGTAPPRGMDREIRSYVTLVASGARSLVDRSPEALIRTALADLRDTLPRARGARLVHATVVKEREATISPAVGWEATRPPTRIGIPRLALAGDWIATGLPSTIESAAMSGHLAAEALAAEQ